MKKEHYDRITSPKRQYFLRINDTPVAILVDDKDDDIIYGCFEVEELNGPDGVQIKPIRDEIVLGYATFMVMGIIEQIKRENENGEVGA